MRPYAFPVAAAREGEAATCRQWGANGRVYIIIIIRAVAVCSAGALLCGACVYYNNNNNNVISLSPLTRARTLYTTVFISLAF